MFLKPIDSETRNRGPLISRDIATKSEFRLPVIQINTIEGSSSEPRRSETDDLLPLGRHRRNITRDVRS